MTSCKFIMILFLLTTFLSPATGQDKEEIIIDIKEAVEAIHLDTSLKSVTLQNQEFIQDTAVTGGELTGFFKGNKVFKIYRSLGMSGGVKITEFYYRKGKLIFVREKYNTYVYDELTKTFDYTKMNSTFNGSYYFDNDKLIEYKTKGQDRFNLENLDPEKFLLYKSDESLGYIKSKLN